MPAIHYGLNYESNAQKIRWFSSLSFAERYRVMIEMADFLEKLSPHKPHARKSPKTIQILRLPTVSKKASGRKIDLEDIKALKAIKTRRRA